MRYLNKFKLNENLTKGDSHQRYLELSMNVVEMIKKQNNIIEDAEDIFYEFLDISGHDIIPLYKIDGYEFHLPEWESRFVDDDIDYINEEWLYEYYNVLDDVNRKEVETFIVYQPACNSNNWTPLKLDERLITVIKELQERYSSIGGYLEYKTSKYNMKDGGQGIWSISIGVPTKTDFSEILKSAVPIKMIKDFEKFCSEYNINPKGRQELARMLRSTDKR